MIIVYDLIFPLIHRNYRSCTNCSVKMEKLLRRICQSKQKGFNTPGTASLPLARAERKAI